MPSPQAEAEQALSAVLRGPLTPALSGATLTLTGQAGTLTLTRITGGSALAPVNPPVATPLPSGTYRLKTLGASPPRRPPAPWC
ncbi:hypothetical protein [Deinococcus multiflagellatus]|uniref:Uncharacterized protein n=1 Tax=Deinococcus multiflagellatus TaxID=1656887 RepID=A0ABW1ZHS3_9DEIO